MRFNFLLSFLTASAFSKSTFLNAGALLPKKPSEPLCFGKQALAFYAHFFSISLSHTHISSISLSLSRALSRWFWQAGISVLCTHFLSLSCSLYLSYTHFLSLSVSRFWQAGITTPVTFELCQNELRCIQVIGKRKDTWLFLFRSHAHHTVEKCPHPSFRTTTRLSLYTSPTLTCIAFDVITYIRFTFDKVRRC
jgi:hypothetical protein